MELLNKTKYSLQGKNISPEMFGQKGGKCEMLNFNMSTGGERRAKSQKKTFVPQQPRSAKSANKFNPKSFQNESKVKPKSVQHESKLIPTPGPGRSFKG